MRTYTQLQKLYIAASIEVANANDNNVQYDLSGCITIDPGALLLIMYFEHILGKKGWHTYLAGQGDVLQILSSNISHYLLPPSQRKTLVEKNPGAYLLRQVSNPKDMVTELEEWAESVGRGSKVDRSQIASWQVQIAEVITNSFQHGPRLLPNRLLPPILIAGRSYANNVQLAALDFGSGIPAVIRDALPSAAIGADDGHVISYACKSGVTSKCDRLNQGAGLPSLVHSAKTNKGLLQIMSLNGLAYVRSGRTYTSDLSRYAFENNPVLAGTLTVINLNTNVQG